ncbi:MAG: precorrin-6A/cobalt-precorrin-6A reductase, partial [Clostridiales bacterium]|nr:precorrin-6A/cobalt-precorrin-6A reductase [Clostridiales bacterium]
MVRAIIFGGTSEGRKLCEYCAKHSIPVLYSTATADGARQTEGLPGILSRYGALNGEEMAALIRQSGVPLVIDATHPFA